MRRALDRFAIPPVVGRAYDAVWADGATVCERAEAARVLLDACESPDAVRVARVPRRRSNDELHGVLSYRGLATLRSTFGLEDARLDADVSGWFKRALLAPDRVFLFPRDARGVAAIEREAEVLEFVGERLPDVAPQLVGLHRNEDVSPYPFLEERRISGTSYPFFEEDLSFDEVAGFIERVGETVASWHDLPTGLLPERLHARPRGVEPGSSWHALLDPARLTAVVAEGAALCGGDASLWTRVLEPVLSLDPVIVHGDVCENQFMVDDDLNVTGVVDSGGAYVGHPLFDVDFGNWGYGVFRWEDRFGELYERLWEAYRARRRTPLPDSRGVPLRFAINEAVSLARVREPSEWVLARRPRALANLKATGAGL